MRLVATVKFITESH